MCGAPTLATTTTRALEFHRDAVVVYPRRADDPRRRPRDFARRCGVASGSVPRSVGHVWRMTLRAHFQPHELGCATESAFSTEAQNVLAMERKHGC